MTRIILDLEWNGAYCKRVGGYFNEIIEIGAVKLSDDGTPPARFDAYIRPVVSKKLTKLVQNLTGITDEQVEDGISFAEAMKRLRRFAGDEPSVLMTWSNTDLLVLMENCRYFFDRQELPFFDYYLDLQHYAGGRVPFGDGQQVGLAKFAEAVGIDLTDRELHHAIDDSVLSAEIFDRVYEKRSFDKAICPIDEEFYRRVTFRTTVISDINNPLIRRGDLHFACDTCGHNLKRVGKWKFFHNMFSASFRCEACDRTFTGRVQAKLKYEGVEVKKRLVYKEPKPQAEEVTP